MQVTFRKHGEIWQWDRNCRLICVGMDDPLAWQVHMASPHDDTDAYVLLPYRTEDGEVCVDIPNVLLQKPGLVAVYAYHVATKEKHTHTCYTFSVNRREMPADYVYTETELWDWQAIEQAEKQRVEAEAAREEGMRLCIEAAAAATAEADLAAEEARTAAENVKDGYTPQKGVDYFTEEDKAELGLTVDQSYSADSENAQSGRAVAEAMNYTLLSELEVTQEAIDAAGEEGVQIISLGSEGLDLAPYDEIALRIHIPDSSVINTAGGLLRIDFSDMKEYISRDKDKFLLTQGTGIATRCGMDVTQNEFLVKGVWSADTFLYGEVMKNGYRGEVGYAGASNCWNCIFYLFKKSEKRFIHIKDQKNVFKFPLGTTVKVYGR